MEWSLIPSLIGYLSPSKSPIAFVTFIGVISLLVSAALLTENRWQLVAYPIYGVLVLAVLLSFKVQTKFKKNEHNDQLRFTRSFGISGGLICLVYLGFQLADFDQEFGWGYAISLTHLCVFLLYTYAKTKEEESRDGINYGQLILITTLFLIGGSYALSSSTYDTNDISGEPADTFLFFQQTAQGLYILWATCMFYWIFELLRSLVLQNEKVWYRRSLLMLIWYFALWPAWLFLTMTSDLSRSRKIINVLVLLPIALCSTAIILNEFFNYSVPIPIVNQSVDWIIENGNRLFQSLRS